MIRDREAVRFVTHVDEKLVSAGMRKQRDRVLASRDEDALVRGLHLGGTEIALGASLRQAHDRDFLRIVSISLVVSGAIGNLYDRVRWSRGVIDFIGPIDLGFWDFPIFNVADMAITCGAVLLALSFWFEEQEERGNAAAASAVANSEPSA